MCDLRMCILQLETVGIRCQCHLLTIHLDLVLTCIPQSIQHMLGHHLYMRMVVRRRVRGILIHLSVQNHCSVLLRLMLIVVLHLKDDLTLLIQTIRTLLSLPPQVPLRLRVLRQDPHIHITLNGIQNLNLFFQFFVTSLHRYFFLEPGSYFKNIVLFNHLSLFTAISSSTLHVMIMNAEQCVILKYCTYKVWLLSDELGSVNVGLLPL